MTDIRVASGTNMKLYIILYKRFVKLSMLAKNQNPISNIMGQHMDKRVVLGMLWSSVSNVPYSRAKYPSPEHSQAPPSA